MTLQLLYTERSPYARKVRVVAIEKQIKLELVECMPFDSSDLLLSVNPASKIPVLLREGKPALVDSPVICEYLDTIGSGAPLIPAEVESRFRILNLAAIADGILDAAVPCVLESMRPEDKIWHGQYDKQKSVVERSLRWMERRADELQAVSMASIALACALDYVEHRLPTIGVEVSWRGDCPQLAAWFDTCIQRESLRKTRPANWERMTAA